MCQVSVLSACPIVKIALKPSPTPKPGNHLALVILEPMETTRGFSEKILQLQLLQEKPKLNQFVVHSQQRVSPRSHPAIRVAYRSYKANQHLEAVDDDNDDDDDDDHDDDDYYYY